MNQSRIRFNQVNRGSRLVAAADKPKIVSGAKAAELNAKAKEVEVIEVPPSEPVAEVVSQVEAELPEMVEAFAEVAEEEPAVEEVVAEAAEPDEEKKAPEGKRNKRNK